jgi:hypothetical protein
LLATAILSAALVAAACTGSQPIDTRRDSGAITTAGEAGSGSGEGTAGAGSSSGAAGTGATAGTSGAAHAGTNGAAGTGSPSSGTAGTGSIGSGAAGTGTAGTTGQAGSGSSTGSGGSKDAGVEAPPTTVYTYSKGIENLLIQNCGGCHYAAPGVNVQGGFSFSYANVTGVTNGHTSCPNLDSSKRRVVPGKPDNSLLWIKAFMDNPPAACGGHMPFQGSRLTDANLNYIKAWILAGAPE